ncbi:MAG: 30S ribosomal protein S9 [Gemmatimonadota bacterium]|jgi:small subunit ribosomal protein S9|nr:30S ribosomal protein S9 [Gemmatimonadota bacterium]MDP6462025.1 30S ribosomal protein S9 [Gemmatimonadota bacterium]MDP6528857.1 30S ribosomal protein S9 [Gemmatimonadota bacterium]MDP6802411.1 30S ribosomal protein S9 [Gemmatimonadota bacterium]MDP7031074.1 30S ribosomal protein S9 [Gemmatimonadota bacterium]
MSEGPFCATGRRKTAVAKVRLVPGGGEHTVNGRNAAEYFPRKALVDHAEKPLDATGNKTRFDVLVSVRGGGTTGQAGAISLGIARALLKLDEELRRPLRAAGLLTRDSRMVERKKYGQPGARKRFQFSKR